MKFTMLNIKPTKLLFTISILCLFFFIPNLQSENLVKVVNLEGTWRFSIGDDPNWSNIDFVAKNWDYVYVPQDWESTGYNGYDGYGWYRKEFKFDHRLNNIYPLYLMLGYIDDVDEVYLNGQLIGGSGIFPPVVTTSYTVLRKYYLPQEILKENNVLAVRVYDEYHRGGIYDGPVGIYYDKDERLLKKNLAGLWDIKSNDDTEKENLINESIFIPGHNNSRGYTGIKGSVVYSRDFTFDSANNEDLWIVLGYIDGEEKVYLNDYYIGQFAELRTSKNHDLPPEFIFRSYKIPKDYLNKENNIVKIEIEDIAERGGIIEGPIGIINTDRLDVLKETQKKKQVNFWEEFIKDFFD